MKKTSTKRASNSKKVGLGKQVAKKATTGIAKQKAARKKAMKGL
jgi:hypothetical protein